ncbi:hypothetical protein ACFPME_01915 [Rhodanobacter umsongensis]|uniref:Uncharacterized protein n=1 Tax=Rhodanobacter umsongensis TaxID=633153 RepID=A0ABW0JHD9_9GAMM
MAKKRSGVLPMTLPHSLLPIVAGGVAGSVATGNMTIRSMHTVTPPTDSSF